MALGYFSLPTSMHIEAHRKVSSQNPGLISSCLSHSSGIIYLTLYVLIKSEGGYESRMHSVKSKTSSFSLNI